MAKKKMKKAGFASARVEKLIRDAGAFRVSADAIYRLNVLLTEHGSCLSKQAVDIAKHTGRKTVKSGDIKLATTNKKRAC